MGDSSAPVDDSAGTDAGGEGDQATDVSGKKSRCARMGAKSSKGIEAAHFSADTLEFIRLLGKHGVRYIIVGGEAVIYHGYARFTGDVDFFYAAEDDNTDRLFQALREFWAGDVPAIRSAADLREPGTVIQFGRPPNRIDLLTSVDGVGFEEAWETRERVFIECGEARIEAAILSLPKLIQNKRASGRAKDLDDLAFLEKLSE